MKYIMKKLKSDIKLSIIVPVYNVYEYIDKCLKSLVNQTLENIEIIVVNDGSPDNSQEIIDKYTKQFPNKIKSFITENGGQGAARNFGIEKASGEFIAFVDSDDFVEVEMYEKMYKRAIEKNSDIVICGNNVITLNGKIIKETSLLFNNNDILNILFGKMAVWNKIYKRSLLLKNKIKFRSKVWYEDVDFTIKVLFSNVKIDYIDLPLYNYIIREGSTMNNKNIERNTEIIYAFDEIIKYFKNEKLYNKYKEEIEFLCIYHIYICGITRVLRIKAEHKTKKIIISKFINYTNDNFKDYKKNKYIKYLDRNKKIIYHLINCRLFNVIELLFRGRK